MKPDEIRNNKPMMLVNASNSWPIAFARPYAEISKAMKRLYELYTQVIAMDSKHTPLPGHRIFLPEQGRSLSRSGLATRLTERKPKPQQMSLLFSTVLKGRASVSNRVIRQQLNITGLQPHIEVEIWVRTSAVVEVENLLLLR